MPDTLSLKSFEKMRAELGHLLESRKDHDFGRAMVQTTAFWQGIQDQFCPHRREGDILLIPGGLFHYAVRQRSLLEQVTPPWVVVAEALAGDMVYFVPGGSAKIMALGMCESKQSMQAIPAAGSRFIELGE